MYDIYTLDGYSGDIRDLAEKAGFIKMHNCPEKFPCPKCGFKTVYTWRHTSNTDICMAAECSYCDFNILTLGTPVSRIGEMFGIIKEKG